LNERTPVLLLAGLLFIMGLLCLVFLVLFLSAPREAGVAASAGSFVGSFLFASFHYAAFFVPVYFISCSVLLLLRPFRIDILLVLNYFILPFFTLGISLRLFLSPTVLDSPLTAFFARSFTRTGGAFLSALLFLLELVILPQLASWLSRKLHSGEPMRFLLAGPKRTEDEKDEPEPTEDEEKAERKFLPILPEDSILAARTASEPAADPSEPLLPPEPVEESPSDTGAAIESVAEPEGEALVAADEMSEEGGEPPVEASSASFGIDEVDEEDETEVEEPAETPAQDFHSSEELPLDDLENDEEETEENGEVEAFEEELEEQAVEPAAEEAPKNPPVPSSRRKKPYGIPVEGILATYSDGNYWEIDEETKRAGDVLRTTLEEFKIQAEVVGIRKGPVITMFEMLPAPGVKLSKIVNLADNIALRLAASSVRIVAPIPGKQAVGIEIPNKTRSIVSFGELITDEKFEKSKMEIPVALGKGIAGDAQYIDLVQTPHLLIAGATGSGKSVCVNSIICSILYRKTPQEVKLILIDPKIVELKFYNDIPHLLTPVITEPKKAFQALQYALYEMERRYSLLDSLGVRDIRSYNRKIKQKVLATLPLPYLVIVVDEFADLMATTGKELESTLARLAAMSRAVGIHIVLATQRPSIDVITGLIKANIPSRIAFMVASKFDSRIIIDAVGAEKLLGRGDMLVASAWDPFPFRMQGAFLSEDEVIVSIRKLIGVFSEFLLILSRVIHHFNEVSCR